jgi:hypothetical protein
MSWSGARRSIWWWPPTSSTSVRAWSPLLSLLPRLAAEAWIADPSRPAADAFFEQVGRHWSVETTAHDVVSIHRLRVR